MKACKFNCHGEPVHFAWRVLVGMVMEREKPKKWFGRRWWADGWNSSGPRPVGKTPPPEWLYQCEDYRPGGPLPPLEKVKLSRY